MLTYPEFVAAIQAGVPRLRTHWLDPEQENAVQAAKDAPLFIVAGPGAGKTTVLALRVLKLMLVDGLRPERMIATTFTRKAAAELRSRLLSWGFSTIAAARATVNRPGSQAFLEALDINRIAVGTLDSLAEQFLIDNRPPQTITPATIEPFLARGLLRRYGFFPNGRYRDPNLGQHLNDLAPHFPRAYSLASQLGVVMQFADRVRHDGIDLAGYAARGAGQRILAEIVNDYFAYLENNHFADYGRLELLLLDFLRQGHLARVVNTLEALLVDELQDTNYLQEQIYVEMCRQSRASFTVVGDDDQSIYRFRGATVEIFASLQQRVVAALGAAWTPTRIDLYRNYRSTANIVAFCDVYVRLDAHFQPARVPGKLSLVAQAPRQANSPVIGMFRDDCQTLAADLSAFLHDVFRGNGKQIQLNGNVVNVVRSASGDFGDAVLLSRSVAERNSRGNRNRLPLLVRNHLQQIANVRVFNPRGRSLGDIPEVQQLLGLALECIDPNARIQSGIRSMTPDCQRRLTLWRTAAQATQRANLRLPGLAQFVANWQARRPSGGMARWPREWPLLELVFTLTAWFPFLQEDPEGQVYLEAIARTVNEVGQMGSFRARVLHGTQWDDNAIHEAIRSIFEPVADESVEVDEEIMPRVPRNYFPMMTVHQAKGLEFPLVIVDVGSDFRTNHPSQRRFRCPTDGDSVHVLEDDVATHTPVGALRLNRRAVERAWDDIRRLYFVAYSRPHDVLLLVGLTSQLRQARRVPAIATGDLFNGQRALSFIPAQTWSQNMPSAASTIALI